MSGIQIYEKEYQKVSRWISSWKLQRRQDWGEEQKVGFFDLIKQHPDCEWNAHLANKGDSKSKRRWLVGKRGNQEPWVMITEREKTPVALTDKQFKSDL